MILARRTGRQERSAKVSMPKLTTGSFIREMACMQNWRLRDWRIANSSTAATATSTFDVVSNGRRGK
ncbi:unnamed protein product [Lasius platythorax]|uniref:Uncharacterized protein n=1 Tax=Lasius platythorax TaxID=488582 RepID=A0AAV2N194_9HYME